MPYVCDVVQLSPSGEQRANGGVKPRPSGDDRIGAEPPSGRPVNGGAVGVGFND